jgi:hypothetical protein
MVLIGEYDEHVALNLNSIPAMRMNFTKYYVTSTNSASSQARSYVSDGSLGFHHHVTCHGLTPAMRYFYVVGCSDSGWSEPASFTMPPPHGDKLATSFAVFGDMGILVCTCQ